MKTTKSLLLICAVVAFCSASLFAQSAPQFVYANDDPCCAQANLIDGWSVDSAGVLKPLAGSPYATGGIAGGGGFLAPSAVLRARGHLLYVGNAGSSDISAFHVDPVTGIPTLLFKHPVPTGGSAGNNGMGLALSPDGNLLFVGNGGSNNISAFAIGQFGGFMPVAGSPFATTDVPVSLLVTRDGKFLVVTQPNTTSIAVFSNNAGVLAPVAGSPFAANGAATGLDTDCAGNFIYVGDRSGGSNITLEIHKVDATTGKLTLVKAYNLTGSHLGVDSQAVLLSPNGRFLYVSNQSSASVTSFLVNTTTGLLKLAPGNPYPDGNPVSDIPSGMSISADGLHLFTGIVNGIPEFTTGVGSLNAGAHGALTQAAGSPFSLDPSFAPQSVVAFPGKACH